MSIKEQHKRYVDREASNEITEIKYNKSYPKFEYYFVSHFNPNIFSCCSLILLQVHDVNGVSLLSKFGSEDFAWRFSRGARNSCKSPQDSRVFHTIFANSRVHSTGALKKCLKFSSKFFKNFSIALVTRQMSKNVYGLTRVPYEFDEYFLPLRVFSRSYSSRAMLCV